MGASSSMCMAIGTVAPRSGGTLPVAVLVLLLWLLFGSVLMSDPPPISYFQNSYRLLMTNEFIDLWFVFDPEGVEAKFDLLSGSEWLMHLDVPSEIPHLEHIYRLLSWS